MDVCVHISNEADIRCLSALLYSMSVFAELESCDLLLSLNAPALEGRLQQVCSIYPARSVSVDAFEPSVTVRHNVFDGKPATQHGEGLNRLIRRTTSPLVILVDPDVLVVSPRWRAYCEDAVLNGAFIVGTPYHNGKARTLWQGTFPNAWCSVIDGRELRHSGADMRPGFRQPPATAAPSAWAPPGGFGRQRLHDCSWELARHAAVERLPHVSFDFSRGKLGGRAGAALSGLSPLPCEFSLPNDEICCLHLMHARRTERTKMWLSVAWKVVDAIREDKI